MLQVLGSGAEGISTDCALRPRAVEPRRNLGATGGICAAARRVSRRPVTLAQILAVAVKLATPVTA